MCNVIIISFNVVKDFNRIIDSGVSALGHLRKVNDEINVIEKSFLLQLTEAVKLRGSERYDIQTTIYSATNIYDVSLSRVFQNHQSNASY